MAAVILASDGEWERFLAVLRLVAWTGAMSWLAGGLADGDWPARLEAELPS